MIKLIEFNQFLAVLGFKEVRILSVKNFLNKVRKKTNNIPLQIFDANCIAGEKHILFATLNALNAFKQNRNISKSIEVEILIYASGQRQITKALEMIGLKEDTSEIAVAFITTKENEIKRIKADVSEIVPGRRDDKVVGFQKHKLKKIIEVYNIVDLDLNAFLNLNKNFWDALVVNIIEKTALLAVKHK